MKKFAVVIICILLIAGLVACGGKGDSGQVSKVSETSETSKTVDSVAEKNPYNLDYESAEIQPMSEDEKASAETLRKTAAELFEEDSIFVKSKYADYTYEDVAEHIGVDATKFFYNEHWPAREYIWSADDDSGSLFLAFAESGGVWKLAALTSNTFD